METHKAEMQKAEKQIAETWKSEMKKANMWKAATSGNNWVPNHTPYETKSQNIDFTSVSVLTFNDIQWIIFLSRKSAKSWLF